MGSFARVPDQARAPGNGDPPARESPRVNNVRFIGQDNVSATRRGDHRWPPMTAEDDVAAVDHMAHQLNRRQRTIAESNPTDTYGSEQVQYLGTADRHETPVGNVRTRHTLPHPATCQQRAGGCPLSQVCPGRRRGETPKTDRTVLPCRPPEQAPAHHAAPHAAGMQPADGPHASPQSRAAPAWARTTAATPLAWLAAVQPAPSPLPDLTPTTCRRGQEALRTTTTSQAKARKKPKIKIKSSGGTPNPAPGPSKHRPRVSRFPRTPS
jgi:hypothetical protein